MIVAVEDIISKNADLENIIKDTDLVRCHVKVCDWFSKNKEYIKQHRLRIYTFPDPEEWCFATFISFMDVIAFRWKKLTPNDQLDEILELCWRLSSRFMLSMHSKLLLNVESFRESIKGKPTNKNQQKRVNNHTLYMETQKEILGIAKSIGFVIKAKINMSEAKFNNQYIYVLYKS